MRNHFCLVFFSSAAATLFFGFVSVSTGATTLERMSLERMSQITKTIARVRCVTNTTVRDSGEIWTITSFDVEQTWRGTLPAQISVRLLGGKLGGITSTVSGVPRFTRGEEAVLFLEQSPRGDFSVVSWQQGTFRIHHETHTGEESVTQDSAAFAIFNPSTGGMQMAGIRRMDLPIFRARVEQAMASSGDKR